jgi:hypothetical protein
MGYSENNLDNIRLKYKGYLLFSVMLNRNIQMVIIPLFIVTFVILMT